MSRWRRRATFALAPVVALLAVDATLRVVDRVRQPDDFARKLEATRAIRDISLRAVLESLDHYPTNSPGSTTWTTVGRVELRAPPIRPGSIRVAYFGEAYGPSVPERLGVRLGPSVEVLDLRTATANSASTLLLARKFLGELRPHVIVADHGFNDILYYSARARGAWSFFQHRARPNAPAFGAVSRGLVGVFERLFRGTEPDELPRWFADAPYREPISNLWQLSRLPFHEPLAVAIVPPLAPVSGEAALDAETRALFPVLGGSKQYASSAERYRDELAALATPSVVIARPLGHANTGGLVAWTDAAADEKASAIADALAPIIKGLPVVAREHTPGKPLIVPEGGLPTTHPRDGTCMRGPCPEQACFVPAGRATYGYANSVIEAHIAKVVAGIGIGDLSWDEDDGPPLSVELSAFCIDRTEASEASRAACVAAAACPTFVDPRHDGDDDPRHWPAIMPTAVDAESYCAFRGGRLPTDAEWEAAARGSGERLLPWGDVWTGKEANYCGRECRFGVASDPDDHFAGAAPIGAFASVSPYGLVDTAGNLWEWSADCFNPDAHRKFPAGVRDPIAVGDRGCRRFLRGGSFQSYGLFLEKRNAEGLSDVDVAGRGVRCVYDFGIAHTKLPVP